MKNSLPSLQDVQMRTPSTHIDFVKKKTASCTYLTNKITASLKNTGCISKLWNTIAALQEHHVEWLEKLQKVTLHLNLHMWLRKKNKNIFVAYWINWKLDVSTDNQHFLPTDTKMNYIAVCQPVIPVILDSSRLGGSCHWCRGHL